MWFDNELSGHNRKSNAGHSHHIVQGHIGTFEESETDAGHASNGPRKASVIGGGIFTRVAMLADHSQPPSSFLLSLDIDKPFCPGPLARLILDTSHLRSLEVVRSGKSRDTYGAVRHGSEGRSGNN